MPLHKLKSMFYFTIFFSQHKKIKLNVNIPPKEKSKSESFKSSKKETNEKESDCEISDSIKSGDLLVFDVNEKVCLIFIVGLFQTILLISEMEKAFCNVGF